MKTKCFKCGKKNGLHIKHEELRELAEKHDLYLCKSCRTRVIIDYLKSKMRVVG